MKNTDTVLRGRLAAFDYSLKRRHDSYWVHSRRDGSVMLGGRWGTSADIVEMWTAQHEQDVGAQLPRRRGPILPAQFSPQHQDMLDMDG
jgi:hypothetical protein